MDKDLEEFLKKVERLIEEDKYDDVITLLPNNILNRLNVYNAMAQGIANRVLDIKKDVVKQSFTDFENNNHRLEFVKNINGIKFIDDSVATNINSTWYALEVTEQPIILLLGGVDKGNDYSIIEELVKQKVKAIICIGLENDRIINFFENIVEVIMIAKNMDEAIEYACLLGEVDDTVLLSPACASFDYFINYEDRGRKFKEAINKINTSIIEMYLYNCSIYLNTSDEKNINQFYLKYKKFIYQLGFVLYSEDEPIRGSWFKEFKLRASKAWNSEENKKRLEKGGYAFELHLIKHKQSEIDRNYVESAASLIKASEEIPEIVLNVGALFLVKATDEHGTPKVLVKTLTTEQLLQIEKRPELVRKPLDLFLLLSETTN